MSLLHRYRNLGETKAPEPVQEVAAPVVTEDQQLEAFEKGYQAGWDDAVKAQTESTSKVSAELGQNLQDMSFTYHEALSKLTLSLKPVMTDIIAKLLPELARETLAPQIVDQINDMLKDQPNQPVEIVVAPENVDRVRNLAGEKLEDPFDIVSEPSLAEGQAFVRIGSTERSIDLEAILAGVSTAMAAFYHETEQENDNG